MVWRVCSEKDRSKAIEFLTEIDKEHVYPVSNFPEGIKGTIDLFFKKGKILLAEQETKPVGLMSYLLGEPSKNYSNRWIGYIYLAVVKPGNQNKPTIVKDGLRLIITEMDSDNVTEVRFKGDKEYIYVNGLYSKLAQPISEELNTQGKLCVLYGVELQKWKEILDRFSHKNNYN